MEAPVSDALVFFGATGDLAYKQIFPALQSMIHHGGLDVPIIGVAKQGWGLDDLKKRAQLPKAPSSSAVAGNGDASDASTNSFSVE